MADECCRTTEDGTTYCALPDNRQTEPNRVTPASEPPSFWTTIRGGAMFVVACALSPCCTPLLVPLALALAAGTPFAAWASLNLGLIYGVLTLVSVVSFVLAWRWIQPGRADARDRKASPMQDTSSVVLLPE